MNASPAASAPQLASLNAAAALPCDCSIYLGITMVFSAMDPPDVYGKGFVHCELAWSHDGKNYTRIQPGHDFIPRGSIENKDFDSHICFASAHPVKLPNETRLFYMVRK
jgi:hypothetical protein